MTKTTILEFAKSIEYMNTLLKEEHMESFIQEGYLNYIAFIKEIAGIKTHNQQLCIEIQCKTLFWIDFFNEWLNYLLFVRSQAKQMIYAPIPYVKKKAIIEDTYLKIHKQKRYMERLHYIFQDKFIKSQV